MSPPSAARHNGPPPMVVQILRAPLTVNNAVAAFMAFSVHTERQEKAAASAASRDAALAAASAAGDAPAYYIPHCGALFRPDAVFGLVACVFVASLVHNFFTVARFHRLRRQVFGSGACPMAACPRRGRSAARRGEIALDDEELEAQKAEWKAKFQLLAQRVPSLFIAAADMTFGVGFMGLYVLTTLLAQKEGKVELGVAYASIGALVACLLNLVLGINGVKMWSRQRRARKEESVEAARDPDLKQPLL